MRKINDFNIGTRLTLINNLVFVLVMVAVAMVVTKTERNQIVEELTHTIEGHNQGLVDMISISNDIVVTDVKYDLNRVKYFYDSIFTYVTDSTGAKWFYKGLNFEGDRVDVMNKFKKEFNEGVKHLAVFKEEGKGRFVCVNARNPEYIGKIRRFDSAEDKERIKNSNVFVFREKVDGVYQEVGCKTAFFGDQIIGLIEVGRNEFSATKVKKNFKHRNLLETGFTMLVEPNGKSKIYSSNCKIRTIDETDFFDEIVKSDSMTGILNTVYNDTAVTIFYSKLKMRAAEETTHYLITIVKESEYLKPVYTTRNIIIIAIIIGIFIFILYSLTISKNISKGIYKLVEIINEISKGNINIELKNTRKDEIGIMTQSVDKLIGGLSRTEGFANSIGEGDFGAEYKLLSEKDSLGLSLIKMQENLADAKAKENERILADDKERWSATGFAKFGEILRNNANDIEKLAQVFMRNLVNYLEVNQGALFIVNDAEDKEDIAFEMKAAIAYERQRILDSSFKIGHGLVGRCAFEKKTIYMTDVPQDYMKITSGMGTANPSVLIIVPLIIEDRVIGIIELASFKDIESYKREFIEKVAESIGSTIVSVTNNDKTKRMLAESIEQKEEMAAQEEELRQNLEEMQATQEDLVRQDELTKRMEKDLAEQRAFTDALMSTLPEYVYFKDLNCKYTKVSQAMLSVFNVTSIDDIMGKSDSDFYNQKSADEYYNEEQQIINTKIGFENKIQLKQKEGGSEMKFSVTKMPLIDKDENCFGIYAVYNEITN